VRSNIDSLQAVSFPPYRVSSSTGLLFYIYLNGRALLSVATSAPDLGMKVASLLNIIALVSLVCSKLLWSLLTDFRINVETWHLFRAVRPFINRCYNSADTALPDRQDATRTSLNFDRTYLA